MKNNGALLCVFIFTGNILYEFRPIIVFLTILPLYSLLVYMFWWGKVSIEIDVLCTRVRGAHT